MARVKRSTNARRRHKKVLKQARGFTELRVNYIELLTQQ